MEAFACVIEPDLDMIVDEGDDIPLNPKTPKKRKRSLAQVKAAAMEKRQMELRRALQARFTAAVRDMQFLGFIRSTKRKVDHVERLTWGHA
ncbi:hypothetical protein SARC_13254 [Sphaeroforma arctica JP610]|uniref:Origin recognition complex subunit 3 winged helix C-terminal domain-containing protein n=1 Tax=Sphaeroforma arctica JP610 TaxID=667725 RepID=A0A0L0FBR4_9EUKA|nr:hypothetical protein SARC_13254 [Sphaeroforma arctica JP610]KNC74190.1 hypothetical protein SARC_13254 [Sphaeroforma arctica JP610]|eukprot:XP_014148092.1 hypothetical protein SARC_13254 [Sphaeroforma arctica JP610]